MVLQRVLYAVTRFAQDAVEHFTEFIHVKRNSIYLFQLSLKTETVHGDCER
ncbi:hypothetical protein NECAME_11113 [Necator americanus]|uniref:Uncharacterized protein n=1 Tax=Necator americanus TaxID=51031 RepID=W2T6W0_NECAM|nr:hypothetical protein NECAME_11113 [Necator americanus]ETN77364.1 hypothetical protein NECAME_11113 [Necator americanus]